jgi:arylsulfatase A-like enzyme
MLRAVDPSRCRSLLPHLPLAALLIALGCAKPTVGPATAPRPRSPAVLTTRPGADHTSHADHAPAGRTGQRHIIVFVWDGLRPDSVDPSLTPQLARLRDERGVNFGNHHSIYPTFTMMNAAALATGADSARHGFYGNYEYQPGPAGQTAKGTEVDYNQPVFTEDHAVLQTLDAFYRQAGSTLLHVETLFEVARAAGLRTAAIGKTGPAFLQDYHPQGETGLFLDENVVLPRSFAQALQAAGLPLPKNTVRQAYPDGVVELGPDNGDPSAPTEPALVSLADGVTPDPRATSGSPHNQRNAYLMRVFIEYVLPKFDPALALIWLRNPDSTQHSYGPGSPNAQDALRHQDQLLGLLLAALERLGRSASTDLLIVSDHGHSSVGSDPEVFPLRALNGEPDGHATIGAIATSGYAVSGEVRSVDWLRRAGFPHAYDGVGCVFDPVLGGVNKRGQSVHPTHEDTTCEKQPRFSTPSYRVPKGTLPPDAIIVAANGGSEYFYVPSHAPAIVRSLVTALQERKAYGPLFVRAVYGAVAGTLPLARIGMESEASVSPPTPDIVVSFDWDDEAVSAAVPHTPGREHSSPQGYRGMHGSFSPRDVHNTLIAVGPDFQAAWRDDYPSSNLDLAPTVAALLGLSLPHALGRVLDESFAHNPGHYHVEPFTEQVGPTPLRRLCDQSDLDCRRPTPGASYGFSVHGQTLSTLDGARHYTYLDSAKATRGRPTPRADVKHP